MRDAFEYFHAFNRQDAEDNRIFAKTKLPMPLLVIGGDQSTNRALEAQARLIADNVKAVKFTAAGHWLMEERPVDTARELKGFLLGSETLERLELLSTFMSTPGSATASARPEHRFTFVQIEPNMSRTRLKRFPTYDFKVVSGICREG